MLSCIKLQQKGYLVGELRLLGEWGCKKLEGQLWSFISDPPPPPPFTPGHELIFCLSLSLSLKLSLSISFSIFAYEILPFVSFIALKHHFGYKNACALFPVKIRESKRTG